MLSKPKIESKKTPPTFFAGFRTFHLPVELEDDALFKENLL